MERRATSSFGSLPSATFAGCSTERDATMGQGSDDSVSTGIVQGRGASMSTCRCRGARSSPWLRWCSAACRAATGGAGSSPTRDLQLGDRPVARGDKVERGRGHGQWLGWLFAIRQRVGSREAVSARRSSSNRPKTAMSACVCVLCVSEREQCQCFWLDFLLNF